MKKYFVTSDIHSFFSQFMRGLKSAGFNETDPDHIIIICGDLFDRGTQSEALFDWIMKFPKDRLILVRGNHELLYLELLNKSLPEKHDYSNGTVRTFCHLAGYKDADMDPYSLMIESAFRGVDISAAEIQKQLQKNWKAITAKVKNHSATKLIQSSRILNYFELDKFIFVHSFIPTQLKDENNIGMLKYYPTYHLPETSLKVIENWRECSSTVWEDATWGCPWRLFDAGLFNEEAANKKILVCGHWHARDFHKHFNNDNTANDDIFISNNLIALDSCIPVSASCNILVVDFDTKALYNQNREKIGEF